MDIKETAKNIIQTLKLVPDEYVKIDVIDLAWDDRPEIRVNSQSTKPDNFTQTGGSINSETPLSIHVLARDRNEALVMMTQAANAVYHHFETLEQTPKSGILCITLAEYNAVQIAEVHAFHAFAVFHILHHSNL